ncbi:MAG TPA: response regulator [Chloroflexota bacterium]|nr:response regulator [Chloroflexota bacterium]
MNTRSTSILVVGDDESLRSAVADSLDQEGFRVETTSSRDALDLRQTHSHRPNLIVLDAAMSDSARLKFLSETTSAKPPIVALSSRTELRAIVAHDGVWLCLAKPVKLDLLVHAVRRIATYTAAA